MEANAWKLATIVSAPFAENTYVVHLAARTDCLIIDPGFDPDAILEYVDRHGLVPAAILLTHGHADHIAGNEAMKQRWPDCPLVIGRGDASKLTDPVENLSASYGLPVVSPPADRLLEPGEIFKAAGFEFDVREIPGHSSGHVVFIWRGQQPIQVLGGDILFAGGIGRTDFPGGSFKQLATGIHEHLFSLPDDTVVWPGHGEPTTIGEEKRTNPFVGRASRSRP